ncbi:hypothetical protein CLV80_101331 [Yoonia maritima]|uniref:Uncharacterized protein n=1 Tax=Yoonia maritima TaxID=1435347 RepID=A0A2T0W4W5_9RHOB|nr:hypothetical protein [Yoonia maritima]PRY80477.1 hypothetical protein CLV80_101331 [Yoonia maritima]
MAESYVQRVADELADLALADQKASGDIAIVDAIGDILGASSQTLQETYLTSVRVRRAEERARAMLDSRLVNGYKDAPAPKAAPLQGLSDEDKEREEAKIAEDAATKQAAPAPEPQAEPEVQATEPTVGMPRRVKR